jgi:putative ABC transport system permease protein
MARFTDVLSIAFSQIRTSKLRSFFTLLGIIVSVAFLVAVVAVIQGMNAYVRENIASSIIGANAFQVRRIPIRIGFFSDEEWNSIRKRPRITADDAELVQQAIPEAAAVGLTSGFPTPLADVVWRDRTIGDVQIYGVTPGYQVVQDYQFTAGRALTEIDQRERRRVVALGADIADKLFPEIDPVGKALRIRGERFIVIGVVAPKGKVLGQSFDGFVMMPISAFEMIYGRRLSTIISVKMPAAELVESGMARAEEAMRISHGLRPGRENDFSVETAEALVSFWKTLTRVLFTVMPAVVAIGVVVGGIVIMNIMLMAVTERTREIGIRKAVGATSADIRSQFLTESVTLSLIGGLLGVMAGGSLALAVTAVSPLPARVTWWSIALAMGLGAGVGILFGVYPATRAARLDPVTAMRAE